MALDLGMIDVDDVGVIDMDDVGPGGAREGFALPRQGLVCLKILKSKDLRFLAGVIQW